VKSLLKEKSAASVVSNVVSEDKLTLTIESALEEFSDVVYRVAASFAQCEADARDIYQEVFMRFLKYGVGKEFNDLEHAKHWFIRVTINYHHTFASKAKRRKEVEKDSAYFKEKVRDHGEVTQALQELDEKYRTVIHLFYYQGYKIKEIADLLEKNENTIKTRLARGKRLLKDKMENDR